jgi:hypothetical protein
MNDDPTRIMRNGDRDPRQEPHYSPDDQKRHMRWLLVGLLAVIVGLVIAIFVISGSDDSEPASSGTTDVEAVTDDGGVVPDGTTTTDETGTTDSGTDSGGVSPETPDTGTTDTGTDSGGTTPTPPTTPTTPDSGGVTPGGTDSSGTDSQSGGIGP